MSRTLTDDDVQAIAQALAVLPRDPYLTTQQTADLLGVSPEWVRSHAAELGGVRIDRGRGGLRFEEKLVRRAMDSRRLTDTRKTRRRPGRQRSADGVELLVPRSQRAKAAV